MNKANRDKVIRFIEKELSNIEVVNFLKSLIISSQLNENLLCLCILIELKAKLINAVELIKITNEIKSNKKLLNYDSYTQHFKEANQILCGPYPKHSKFSKQKYSKVMILSSFFDRVGDALHKPPKFKIGQILEIDEDKIKRSGWSGYKGIVWITPYEKMLEIVDQGRINNSKYPANDVCDFAGFARIEESKDKMSPKSPTETPKGLTMIIYSEKFNDVVFQPNSSNANWLNTNTLYISYLQRDGFGRTYNENLIEFAKEQIHLKSHYCDEDFSAVYLGEISIDEKFCRSNILDEALKRLEI